jgi:Skp family chaperone for outer membrane proteins
MSDYNNKRRYKKKQAKELNRKKRQARRSKATKEENREKKVIEKIQWQNRSRIAPIRNDEED